ESCPSELTEYATEPPLTAVHASGNTQTNAVHCVPAALTLNGPASQFCTGWYSAETVTPSRLHTFATQRLFTSPGLTPGAVTANETVEPEAGGARAAAPAPAPAQALVALLGPPPPPPAARASA